MEGEHAFHVALQPPTGFAVVAVGQLVNECGEPITRTQDSAGRFGAKFANVAHVWDSMLRASTVKEPRSDGRLDWVGKQRTPIVCTFFVGSVARYLQSAALPGQKPLTNRRTSATSWLLVELRRHSRNVEAKYSPGASTAQALNSSLPV